MGGGATGLQVMLFSWEGRSEICVWRAGGAPCGREWGGSEVGAVADSPAASSKSPLRAVMFSYCKNQT